MTAAFWTCILLGVALGGAGIWTILADDETPDE
jgi:hypothetical protein